MQIFKGVGQIKPLMTKEILQQTSSPAEGFHSSVVTIGNFDGVHLGHRQLIENVVREALHFGVPGVVYTFDPHPLKVISSIKGGGKSTVRLFDLKDQMEQFKALGIKAVVVEPFTTEFAKVTASEFLTNYLLRYLNPKTLVVGHDFSFGANREGTIKYLEDFCAEKGIRLIIIPPFQFKGMVVSSTKIREALTLGNVELANELLGRRYYLRGVVQKGFQRGRLIGVPTANIHPDVEFIPRRGVYATLIKIDGQEYQSITNIGVNPTFEESGANKNLLKVETHIFDFQSEVYEMEAEVRLLHFIRDEKKFNGLDELKEQIQNDVKEVRRYFNECH